MTIRRKKRSGWFLFVVAFMAYLFLTHSPRFPTLHYVDMLLLVAMGACIGAGISLVVLPYPSSE